MVHVITTTIGIKPISYRQAWPPPTPGRERRWQYDATIPSYTQEIVSFISQSHRMLVKRLMPPSTPIFTHIVVWGVHDVAGEEPKTLGRCLEQNPGGRRRWCSRTWCIITWCLESVELLKLASSELCPCSYPIKSACIHLIFAHSYQIKLLGRNCNGSN